MEDLVLVTNEVANTVAIVQSESVVVDGGFGNTITLTTESTILLEVPQSTLVVTGIMGPPGPAAISEEDMTYSKRIDFVSDNELYRGEAVVGSMESASTWRIRRVVIANDGDVSEKWASGNDNFDKAWTDRLTLIYS